jgi:hypothetical protein
MEPSSAKPDRTLIVILSVIGGIVVLALVAVFLRPPAAPLDPASPAGVVQAYSAAVIDGDTLAARQYLVQGLREDCAPADPTPSQRVQVTLVSTEERDEEAVVRVSLLVSYGSGPFGSGDYEDSDSFQLVKEDGTWVIRTAPYALTVCYDMEAGQ